MSDFFEKAEHEIAQRLEAADAENWDPDPNVTLRGAFVEAKVVQTQHGPTTIATIKDHDTNKYVNVWLGRTRLKQEFFDQVPAPGSLLVLTYHGLVEAKRGGNPYNNYTLVAQSQDYQYWANLGPKLASKPSERQANSGGVNPEAEKYEPF